MAWLLPLRPGRADCAYLCVTLFTAIVLSRIFVQHKAMSTSHSALALFEAGIVPFKPCPSKSFCLDIGGAALPAGVGAVLGGVGGAVVGILLPSHSTIYQVSPH